MKTQHQNRGDTLSMTNRGTRIHFDIALALVAVIPLLSVMALILPAFDAVITAPSQYVMAAIGFFVAPAAGFAMLARYPVMILRLRAYLEDIVRGEIPDKITLVAGEADLAAIEHAMNLIIETLRRRLARTEHEKACLEEELQQARTLEAINTLAAGIAHEINTPLQFIRVNLDFLDGICRRLLAVLKACVTPTGASQPLDSRIEKDVAATVTESQEGIDRIAEIVAALRDFANRGDNSGHGLLNVNAAVRHAVELTRNDWKCVANIAFDLATPSPLVMCAPAEIKQSLVNLLLNASQALRDRPARAAEELGTITLSSRLAHGRVTIAVRDTGCGIPDDVRPRIFEPFFTTREVGKGKGNGLTFVFATVVTRHGGRVSCESTVGQGTTLRLELPAAPSTAAAPHEEDGDPDHAT